MLELGLHTCSRKKGMVTNSAYFVSICLSLIGWCTWRFHCAAR